MKKVLIVIDMQNDFISGALKNPDAEAIVPALAQTIEAFDGDIIATRDTHANDYLSTSEGKYLPVSHCIKGTHGWEIEATLARALEKRNAKLLDKPTFGFLDWNGLEKYDEAILTGTCTDICVVSNALILKAKYPNLRLKVIPSLCAGTSKENHEAALKVMACCQTEII